MSEQSIKHDADGFLLPEKQKQDIEQILSNTEKLLDQSVKPRKPRNNIFIRVSQTVTAPKSRIQAAQTPKKQPEQIAKAITKETQKQQQVVRANPIQKREQKDRTTAIKEAKTQTEILTKIADGQNGDKKSLLSNLLKAFGMGGGLLKNLLKSPFKFLSGGLKGVKGAMRGQDGKFVAAGSKGGLLGGVGKLGKGFFRVGKGFLKGGLAAALFGLLGGIDVENSNMSRSDKNKQHLKNGAIGLGGLGGMAAGAAIGSVIPGIGTLIGGILGGFGGAQLMEVWVEKLEKAIDPKLSREMLGSWGGFVNGLKFGWTHLTGNLGEKLNGLAANLFTLSANVWAKAGEVWETLMPDSIKTHFQNLNNWGKSAWDSFSGSTKNLFSGLVAAWNKGMGTIAPIAQNVFNFVSDTSKKVVDYVENTPVGQTIKQGAQAVGDYVIDKAQAVKNNALSFIGYDMTQKYDNLKYKRGRKSLNAGMIDCSGWTFQVSKMEMGEINKMLGFEKYKIKGNQAGMLNLGNHGAAEQIGVISGSYGVVTDSRDKGGLDVSKLQAGMLIGQFSPTSPYKGRYANVKGYGKTRYNHITKVVRGKDGKLYISESRGGAGVMMTEATKWVAEKQRHQHTLTAVNPYGDDIGLLNGNVGSVAKAMVGRAAQKVVSAITPQANADTIAPNVSGDPAKLGIISAKYEGKIESANPDVDQNGRPVGWAYGKYQFNSAKGGLAQFFKDNPEIAREFNGLTAGSDAFKAKWKELARRNPKAFEAAQDQSAAKLWYAPAKKAYEQAGFDLNNRGVQEAVFSSSIQHGGVVKSLLPRIKNRAQSMGKNITQMSPQEQIRLIYAERASYHAKGRKRYAAEVQDALKLANASVAMPPQRRQSVQAATAPKTQAVQPKIAQPVMMKNLPHAKVSSIQPVIAVKSKGTAVGAAVGRLAHQPVSRTVSNQRIAHNASGGIMDGTV